MKKQLVVLPILLGSLLTAFSAQAADSVELKIKGTIVPSSCNPVFSGGNVVNFGNIPAESLSESSATKLSERRTDLTIICGAAAKVALKFKDNKATSAVTGLFPTTHNMAQSFGLGTHAGKKIGSFYLRFNTNNMEMDGSTVKTRMSSKDLVKWTAVSNQYVLQPGDYIAFGTGTTPQGFKKMAIPFMVAPFINKTSALPVTEKIDLDGSVTMEMHYI